MSARNCSVNVCVKSNLRPTDKSACVKPKPGTTFLPRVPCRGCWGIENAAGFSLWPPGAVGSLSQKGTPATRSGLVELTRPGMRTRFVVTLIGSPLLASTTASIDQFLDSCASSCCFAKCGTSQVTAPEKLCRTSNEDDPRSPEGENRT